MTDLDQLREDLEVLANCLALDQGIRTCAFCGVRDPMWHGVPSRNWSVLNGLPRCPDCAWMDVTVPKAAILIEPAATKPIRAGKATS